MEEIVEEEKEVVQGSSAKRRKTGGQEVSSVVDIDNIALIARMVVKELQGQQGKDEEERGKSSSFWPWKGMMFSASMFSHAARTEEEGMIIHQLGPYIRNGRASQAVFPIEKCDATMLTFFIIRDAAKEIYHRLYRSKNVVNVSFDKGEEDGEFAVKVIVSTDPRVADFYAENNLSRLRDVDVATRTFLARDDGKDPVGDMLTRCFDAVYFTERLEKRETIVNGRTVAILPIGLGFPVDLEQILQIEVFPAFQNWKLSPSGDKSVMTLHLSVFVHAIKKR